MEEKGRREETECPRYTHPTLTALRRTSLGFQLDLQHFGIYSAVHIHPLPNRIHIDGLPVVLERQGTFSQGNSCLRKLFPSPPTPANYFLTRIVCFADKIFRTLLKTKDHGEDQRTRCPLCH